MLRDIQRQLLPFSLMRKVLKRQLLVISLMQKEIKPLLLVHNHMQREKAQIVIIVLLMEQQIRRFRQLILQRPLLLQKGKRPMLKDEMY
jgi:hypothetical protein